MLSCLFLFHWLLICVCSSSINNFNISLIPLFSSSDSTTFKAKRISDGKEGCLKISKELDILDLFELEKRFLALSLIESKYILKCFEVFVEKNRIIIFTEKSDIGNIQNILERAHSESEVINISSQILNAVSVLEINGNIPLLIKPENVLLFQKNQVKIDPFSFSIYLNSLFTSSKGLIYHPPEIWSNYSINTSSPVWSFGMILYQLAYGSLPFQVQSQIDFITLHQKFEAFPTLFENFSSNFSDSFHQIISGTLKREKINRISFEMIQKSSLFSPHFEIEISNLTINVDSSNTTSTNLTLDLKGYRPLLNNFENWIFVSFDFDFSSISKYNIKKTIFIIVPSQIKVLANTNKFFVAESNPKNIEFFHPFQYLSENTFYQHPVISVNLSCPLITIGHDCFSHCTLMKTITLPSTLVHIGEWCFYSCLSLESFSVPPLVTSIGDFCFGTCFSLESIFLPPSITKIGHSVFFKCAKLKNVTLPTSISKLPHDFFSHCIGLQSIKIPSSITEITNGCFFVCTSLENVILPSSLLHLYNDCFLGCDSLKTITLPDSLRTIGQWCFYKCNSLESITITASSIGKSCFQDCKNLTEVIFTSAITRIGNSCFRSCSSLTSVVFSLPSKLSEIPESCFYECVKLSSINIPNSVQTLYRSCFYRCNALFNPPSTSKIQLESGSKFTIEEIEENCRSPID